MGFPLVANVVVLHNQERRNGR